MTNVNVDVQILITGPTGSGKGLVMDRIREFLSKQVSNGITQKHSFQNYFADGVTFSLDGELLQSAGPKAPKETHTDIPGYPDADKMLDYLVAKVNKTALSESLKSPKDTELNVFMNQPKTEPFKVIVRNATGVIVAFREDKHIRNGDRVVTLFTAPTIDAPTDPVGMDQAQAQTASLQPSEDPAPGLGFHTGGYVSRCAIIEPKQSSIELTKAEIQSGVDRVRWAEGLIRQLPKDHDGRNSWLMNYGQMSDEYAKEFIANVESCKPKTETETGAPEDHAHNKAHDALLMLNPSISEQFQPLTDFDYVSCDYPGGLVGGNLVQIITPEGSVLIGKVNAFHWHNSTIGPVVVYWRRM